MTHSWDCWPTTPLENRYSPAELLMGHKIRSMVPVIPKLLHLGLPNHSQLCSKERKISTIGRKGTLTIATKLGHWNHFYLVKLCGYQTMALMEKLLKRLHLSHMWFRQLLEGFGEIDTLYRCQLILVIRLIQLHLQPHWRNHRPYLQAQTILTLFVHTVARCQNHLTDFPELNYPERGDVVVGTIYHVWTLRIHS